MKKEPALTFTLKYVKSNCFNFKPSTNLNLKLAMSAKILLIPSLETVSNNNFNFEDVKY